MKKNGFYEIILEITRQKGEFSRHAKRLEHISDPKLDPLHLELKGFSDYDTPRGVINAILNQGGLKEVDFQYLITVNALEKLKAVLRLVEAQKALKLQIEEPKISVLEETVQSDSHQIAERFQKAVTA